MQRAQQFANKNFDKARKHAYKSGWSEEEVKSAMMAIRRRDGTKKSAVNRRTLLLQLVSDLLRTSVAWLSFPKVAACHDDIRKSAWMGTLPSGAESLRASIFSRFLDGLSHVANRKVKTLKAQQQNDELKRRRLRAIRLVRQIPAFEATKKEWISMIKNHPQTINLETLGWPRNVVADAMKDHDPDDDFMLTCFDTVVAKRELASDLDVNMEAADKLRERVRSDFCTKTLKYTEIVALVDKLPATPPMVFPSFTPWCAKSSETKKSESSVFEETEKLFGRFDGICRYSNAAIAIQCVWRSLHPKNRRSKKAKRRRRRKRSRKISISSSFQIFVQVNGKTITLDVKPNDMAESIKSKIENKQGIPVKEQRLIFDGKQLGDDQELHTFGIRKESTLQLTLRLLGGTRCKLSSSHGDVHSHEFPSHELAQKFVKQNPTLLLCGSCEYNHQLTTRGEARFLGACLLCPYLYWESDDGKTIRRYNTKGGLLEEREIPAQKNSGACTAAEIPLFDNEVTTGIGNIRIQLGRTNSKAFLEANNLQAKQMGNLTRPTPDARLRRILTDLSNGFAFYLADEISDGMGIVDPIIKGRLHKGALYMDLAIYLFRDSEGHPVLEFQIRCGERSFLEPFYQQVMRKYLLDVDPTCEIRPYKRRKIPSIFLTADDEAPSAEEWEKEIARALKFPESWCLIECVKSLIDTLSTSNASQLLGKLGNSLVKIAEETSKRSDEDVQLSVLFLLNQYSREIPTVTKNLLRPNVEKILLSTRSRQESCRRKHLISLCQHGGDPIRRPPHGKHLIILCQQFLQRTRVASSTFNIFIKSLRGETQVFRVKPDTTVANVKQMIQDKEGIPCEQQRLIFGFKSDMSNDRTLSDYNVQNENSITLSLRIQGGAPCPVCKKESCKEHGLSLEEVFGQQPGRLTGGVTNGAMVFSPGDLEIDPVVLDHSRRLSAFAKEESCSGKIRIEMEEVFAAQEADLKRERADTRQKAGRTLNNAFGLSTPLPLRQISETQTCPTCGVKHTYFGSHTTPHGYCNNCPSPSPLWSSNFFTATSRAQSNQDDRDDRDDLEEVVSEVKRRKLPVKSTGVAGLNTFNLSAITLVLCFSFVTATTETEFGVSILQGIQNFFTGAFLGLCLAIVVAAYIVTTDNRPRFGGLGGAFFRAIGFCLMVITLASLVVPLVHGAAPENRVSRQNEVLEARYIALLEEHREKWPDGGATIMTPDAISPDYACWKNRVVGRLRDLNAGNFPVKFGFQNKRIDSCLAGYRKALEQMIDAQLQTPMPNHCDAKMQMQRSQTGVCVSGEDILEATTPCFLDKECLSQMGRELALEKVHDDETPPRNRGLHWVLWIPALFFFGYIYRD